MDQFARLQLVGRVSYYLGWVALIAGGLVHLNVGRSIFLAMSLTKRNLFEVSVVLFVICMASQLRALASAGGQVAGVVKREMAA
jgi:hypothetical protein